MRIVEYGGSLFKGIFEIHSKFLNVINLNIEGGSSLFLNSIVDKSVGSGPQNIVVVGDLATILALEVGEQNITVRLNDGRAHCFKIDGLPRYNSSIGKIIDQKKRLFKIIDIFEQTLITFSKTGSIVYLLESERRVLENPVEKLIYEKFVKTINWFSKSGDISCLQGVKGLGFGLTPSGDDFLAGALLALKLCDKECLVEKLYSCSLGKNLISNTMLYNIRNGFYHMRLKLLINTIFSCDVDSAQDRIADLIKSYLDIGHSSGADFLVGFVIVLKSFRS